MATAYVIDFEGGTAGDAIVAGGNISGVVGSPVKTAESLGGTRAMLCSGLASTLIQTDWGANPITHTVSVDVKPKSLSGSNVTFLTWGDTAGLLIAALRFGTGNKVELADGTGTVRATSTTSWAAGVWYRFEADYDGTAPMAPIVTVRIYTVFGTAPVETVSFTFSTVMTMGRVQYGGIGTQASGARVLIIDSIQVAYGIQRIGPLVTVVAPAVPVVTVQSPLRVWTALAGWPRATNGLVVALPPVAKITATRTWNLLPATARTSSGIAISTPTQAAKQIARVRSGDGWGIRGSLAQLIASTFTASSTTVSSGLSTVIDITGATVGDWIYLFAVLDAAQTGITVTNAANPAGWVQVLEGDEAATTHYALYRRMKRAGDTTFTVAWPSSAKGTFGLVAYSGLDPSGPPDLGAAVALHTSGLTYPSPSAVPLKDTWWAATFTWSRTSTAANKAIAFAPDSALTERLDFNNSAAAASPWTGQQIADSNGPVSLTSHSYINTQAFAESHGGAILLYLVPAS